MSKEKFEALQVAVRSTPREEVVVPNRPIEVYIQEASDLQVWAAEDRTQLKTAGMNKSMLYSLSDRLEGLRYAQSSNR